MVSYYAKNLKEALEYRAENATPYAGGTDLMIEANPSAKYVFINKVPELKQMVADNEYIRIGSGCTFSEIASNPICPPILKEAVLQIAAPAIRNMGTIGGNIANGSAKADCALIIFAAKGKLRLMSNKNERIIPIKDFYKGRKILDLKPDELIVEILIPKTGLDNYYYQKVGARGALAISRISFCAILELTDNKIGNISTAFGAITDVIIARDDIDAMLIGKTIDEAKKLKADYISAFEKAIVPIKGRVSEEYRKEVSMNLLKDFLNTMGI